MPTLSEQDAEVIAVGKAGNYGDGFAGWDDYTNARPAYPPAVFEEIFAFHDSHGLERGVAVDFATGHGQIVPQLLEGGFSKVEGTDVSKPAIELGRNKFGADSRVNLQVANAAEKHHWIADRSVSLVTCFEAIHWLNETQLSEWLVESARLLKPGGTLVVVTFPGECSIVSNNEANEAFHAYLRKILYLNVENDPSFKSFGGLLHVVPPPSLFDNVTRVIWNKFPPGSRSTTLDALAAAQGTKWDQWRRQLDQLDSRPVIMKKRLNMDAYMRFLDSSHGVGDAMRKSEEWQKTSKRIVELTGDDFEMAWIVNLCMATRR